MGLRTSYCLQVPAGSALSEALRSAGAEAKAKRYEAAILQQRRALHLCAGADLHPGEVVVVELTLASYQLHVAVSDPSRAEEAAVTLLSVIRGTRLHGMDHERIQAEMGLATARSLQRRHADAAEAYLNAASVAKQVEEPLVVGEFLRCSADALFEDGQRSRAVLRWRAALGYLLDPAEVPTLEILDDVEVLTHLQAACRRLGLNRVVRRYEDVLARLVLLPGTN